VSPELTPFLLVLAQLLVNGELRRRAEARKTTRGSRR
jgi:hypothetical protein